MGCEHVYANGSGGVRIEYESLCALGPLCGVDDPACVRRSAALCDQLGIDTITTGGTIAFLMECAERGLIGHETVGRRPPRFGDGESVIEAIQTIVDRRGAGEL